MHPAASLMYNECTCLSGVGCVIVVTFVTFTLPSIVHAHIAPCWHILHVNSWGRVQPMRQSDAGYPWQTWCVCILYDKHISGLSVNENEIIDIEVRHKNKVIFSSTLPRVRVAAAESMPLLLECAQVRGREYLTQMWHFMCDALIKSIGTEPDSDVLSEIMHAFAKVGLSLKRICEWSLWPDWLTFLC